MGRVERDGADFAAVDVLSDIEIAEFGASTVPPFLSFWPSVGGADSAAVEQGTGQTWRTRLLMRRVLCAIIACLVVAPPSAGAAEPRAITLSGSRSASVLVTFKRALTVYGGDSTAGEVGPSITGNADLAGYLLADPSGRRIVSGLVTTTRVKPQGEPARWDLGGSKVRVPAGRYLLTLIASAQTEVRIPADGLAGSVTYRPTKAVPVSMTDTPLEPTIGTGSSGRAAVTLTARTVTLLGLAFKTTAAKGRGGMCVTPKGRSCPGVAGSMFAFQPAGVPVVVNEELSFADLLRPDEATTGRYDAVWSVSVDGLCTDARGVAVTIG